MIAPATKLGIAAIVAVVGAIVLALVAPPISRSMERNRLRTCIQAGDLDCVRSMVTKNPRLVSVEVGDPAREDNLQPLGLAVGLGKDDICRYLVSAGADLNHLDRFGMTALHHAVEHGNVRVVVLLVSAGADPNIVGIDRRTPLEMASDEKVRQRILEAISPLTNKGTASPQL